MSVHPFVYLNPRPVHSSWFVVWKVQWNQRTCRYPSRLFVDFQYRRNHGDDDKLWQLSVCHYLRSAPVFPLETKRPLHRRCQRMYTHEKIAKASNKENWKLIDVSKEKRKRIFSFFFFFFCMRLFFFSHLRNSKQALTWSHVSDRPGPKSRVAGILSHLRLSFFCFTFFFFLFFFCVVVGGLLLLLLKKKKIPKGVVSILVTHIHTTDHGLVVQGVLRSGVNMIYSELSRWRFSFKPMKKLREWIYIFFFFSFPFTFSFA